MQSQRTETLPPAAVNALDAVAREAPGVSDWWIDLVPVAQALHREYVRGIPLPPSCRPARWHAYLPFFGPRYIPRIAHALRAADLDLGSLLRISNGHVRVLDLGAGPGTLSLACLLELQAACERTQGTLRVDLVLRDMDPSALQVASRLLSSAQAQGAWPRLDVRFTYDCRDACSAAGPGVFDLVLIGHMVCEFYQRAPLDRKHLPEALDRFFCAVEDQLSSKGVAILLEPVSLEAVSLPLFIRDFVYSRGVLSILAPCLGQGATCPEHGRPYWNRPACSASTRIIRWDDGTMPGLHLRLFNEAMLQIATRDGGVIRGVTSAFFTLILGRERPEVPVGIGMSVRRLDRVRGTRHTAAVCTVEGQGAEQVYRFRAVDRDARFAVLEAFNVRDRAPLDSSGSIWHSDLKAFSLSALYRHGWPVLP